MSPGSRSAGWPVAVAIGANRAIQTLLLRRPGAMAGDQFNYRRNKNNSFSKNSSEALAPEKFTALLDNVEEALKKMGRDIYSGVAHIDPYRKGTQKACDLCEYASVCRIDPWTHIYRILEKPDEQEPA